MRSAAPEVSRVHQEEREMGFGGKCFARPGLVAGRVSGFFGMDSAELI
jgi:hypothetical protein